MAMWGTVTEVYHDIFENKSDPRVKDWLLMSSPIPIFLICISYALVVKVIGPKLMENRKPFQLRRTMLFYNLFQIISSAYLCFESLRCGWWNNYSFRCQPVDYSNTSEAIHIARMSWVYFLSKFVEFFDTIAFVLRKKNDNISNLHVYHHGSMPIVTWLGVKFVPGGHVTFFGLLNTFVHTIMYGYYFLAALGPHMQPYLWWKKYLTTLQLTQFALVILHSSQLFFIECDYSIVFTWITLVQAFIFIVLFSDFYIKSYRIKKPKNIPTVSHMKAKKQ